MSGRPLYVLAEQVIILGEQVIMMMVTEMMRIIVMLMMDMRLEVFVIFLVMLVGRQYGAHF